MKNSLKLVFLKFTTGEVDTYKLYLSKKLKMLLNFNWCYGFLTHTMMCIVVHLREKATKLL